MSRTRRTEALDIQPAPGLEEYHDFSRPEDLKKYRDALAAPTLSGGRLPDDISVVWKELGGVRTAYMTKAGAPSDRVLFHIHGGAWNGGVPCTGQRVFVEIMQEADINIVSVEYRLAPEHPYPAGLEDCIAAYLALLDTGIKSENIILIGESAGGNLCAALTLYLKDNGKPLPAANILLSPGAKMQDIAALEKALERDPGDLKLSETIETYRMYIGGADPRHPYLSPVYGDFRGFPPTLIQFGGTEFLQQECAELTWAMMKAGVDVLSHCWEFMPHVFVMMQDVIPEAAPAKKELVDYIRSIFD